MVNSLHALRRDVLIVDIGRYPHNAQWRGDDAHELQYGIGPDHMAADRILIREHPLGQGAAHDYHLLTAAPVADR